jgi:hypothetical protein
LLGAPQIAVPAALAYLLWPSIALMSPLAYKEGAGHRPPARDDIVPV